MKIKKLIAMKEECENKLECIELALGYADEWDTDPSETGTKFYSKITLTPEQARDIQGLLMGYKKLLDLIINSAEVDIG